MNRIRNFIKSRKGAAMIEYALLVAGIAIVAVAAISILGHKTSDMVATSATILPGANTEDNSSIDSGRILETTDGTSGPITVDVPDIEDKASGSGGARLGDNLGYGNNGTDLEALVTDTRYP